MTSGDVVFEVRSLAKSFAGVRVLDDFSFDVRREVHALVGQNGSGKSTFIKLLAGYHRPDQGSEFEFHGAPVHHDQLSHHLRFVHQDLGLVNELSATENMALKGALRTGKRTQGFRRHVEADQAQRLLAEHGLADFDVSLPLANATMVEKTIVAIAAALSDWEPSHPHTVVFDEPTAALPPREANQLLDRVRSLRSSGAAVIYVSHRLDEIFAIADRVTVLRNGRKVGTYVTEELTKADLVHLMVGEDIDPDQRFNLDLSGSDVPVMEVDGVCGRYMRGASFKVNQGEVVGIAGLPDSGRDELPGLLAQGPRSGASGRIRVQGEGAEWKSLAAWRPTTAAYLPPDRARQGVVAEMSSVENLSLLALTSVSSGPVLSRRRERAFTAEWVSRLGIVGPIADPIRALSGGNQQKVLLARCLAMGPQLLVLCEPTAGVDVGARQAIYQFISDEVRKGLSVLVASSDTGDILALCTRVLVLRNGEVVDELRGDAITELALVRAMEGIGAEGSSSN
jgi:ribose transport system ATP-binding protein